jgi:cytochrome c oxidase cbb3-type subunit 3
VNIRRLLTTCGFASLLAAGCRRAPPDLREWRTSDHDQQEEQSPNRTAAARAAPTASANPIATLVEVAWRNQCAACHGPVGRGDGPQGPMLHAPDLTAAAWQSKVTDEQIQQVIANGKNRMPKFELPPDILAGLVGRIRANKGK